VEDSLRRFGDSKMLLMCVGISIKYCAKVFQCLKSTAKSQFPWNSFPKFWKLYTNGTKKVTLLYITHLSCVALAPPKLGYLLPTTGVSATLDS
jgi:hypothetical protein